MKTVNRLEGMEFANVYKASAAGELVATLPGAPPKVFFALPAAEAPESIFKAQARIGRRNAIWEDLMLAVVSGAALTALALAFW